MPAGDAEFDRIRSETSHMTRSRAGLDRLITVILTLLIASMAAVLVRRELRHSDNLETAQEVQAPTFVSEWRSLLSRGVLLGDSMAPLQLVEFVDFQCPVCRQQHDALRRAKAKYGRQLAITLVHFPLGIHPFAGPAARAAECARRYGAFERFADVLFAKQDSLGLRSWDSYGRDAAINDSAGFVSCIGEPDAHRRVAAGEQAGRDFAVTATPTLMVNGWRYRGALSFSQIDDLLSRLIRGELPRGVSGLLSAATAAGVTTVQNGVRQRTYDDMALQQARQLSLAPEPLAVMGGEAETAEFDLTNARDVIVLADERVVAFARIGARVLVFSSTGRGERRIGRTGRGPNELHNPANLARAPGDSLVLLDRGNRRVYWATVLHGIARARSLEANDLPQQTEMVAGVLPNRAVVLYGSERWPSNVRGDAPVVAEVPVAVLTDSGPATAIGTVPGASFVNIETRYRGRASRDVDFVRLSPRAHVIVWDSLIATASSSRYRVELRTGEGPLLGALEVKRPRRKVSDEMRRTVIADELRHLRTAGGEPPVDAAESERLIRAARFADSLPAFHTMHVAPDGTLWIVDAIAPGDLAWEATGFRLDGSIVGRLRGPASGVPVAFGNDRVVLRRTNEEGVVTLGTYQVVIR